MHKLAGISQLTRITIIIGNSVSVVFTVPVSFVIAAANVTNPILDVMEKLDTTLTDTAPVAVDATLTALLAASATRRSFQVRSIGPGLVAIGGAAWSTICAATETVTPNILKVIE